MNLRNLSQEELIQLIDEQNRKIEILSEQVNWYSQQIKNQQKKLFGSSSEKTVLPDQISLFDEVELESSLIKIEPQLEEITYKRKKNRKKRQRGIDISALPVITQIHDLENKECIECGEPLRKIGENKRKELIYYPARYEVVEHIQYVYTCDDCEKESLKSTMYKGEMKDALIPGSFLSPSLAASIIDNKYNQALPLYRQEVIFKQNGLSLSRQTMANWMVKLYELYLNKVMDYMHKTLLQSEYIHGDETTTQVLRVPNQKATTKSYM